VLYNLLAPGSGSTPVPGWSVESRETVPEWGLTVFTLRHTATGATYVHIDTEDTHNFFSLSFRTPVAHDMGTPHVLEHVALCGSRRFDVRDPFHAMSKRSVNTDMNAATGPDHTNFHFSTQNAQDFANLLSVYLDAAFFPRLRRADFEQEGHRVEPSDPADASSPLEIKGVVYNEMQGHAAIAAEAIGHGLYQALLPGTPYAHNAGGDPAAIPDLTYEQLSAFHATHYHPSNAIFVTFGDLPLLSHLAAVSEVRPV
jgi:Zn-dependent M16 (insulinase) family peptidase